MEMDADEVAADETDANAMDADAMDADEMDADATDADEECEGAPARSGHASREDLPRARRIKAFRAATSATH